jgi:riboflavin synthase
VFTGIVQGLCRIVSVVDEPQLRRLVIDLGPLVEGVQLGASVAINGVCLTVTSLSNRMAHFDVIAESLARTNLSDLVVGARVNAERSLRFGDEIGGHVVSGHVSDAARVVAVETDVNLRNVHLEVAPQWMRYLHYKGFVAVDGASLTISAIDRGRNRFGVSLIPETIARTTLGSVVVGERVNVEVDAQTQAVVDTVERLLADREWRAEMLGVRAPA